MNPLIALLVTLILTLVNAFFAMSEVAIITLNDTKIKKLAETGHKAATKIVKLTSNSSGFLATIQVGVTLAGFMSSAFAADSFADKLEPLLAKIPVIGSIARPLATILITLLLSFFTLVFGELVPKKIGMQRAEPISYKIVGVLLFIGKIFKPFVWMLSAATNGMTRLVGLDPFAEEETLTEEEILMMVDVGGERGVIEESERDMIANIFEFGDTTASEVMTHRTEVYGVENTDTVSDVIELTTQEGFSRIPVYVEDLDNIIGIVYVKDLLKYVVAGDSGSIPVTEVMRPAYFIPESKRLDNLFSEMTDKKMQMAVVIDEYGGTAGIITMEDLIESIVGNIQDEYDNEDDEISQVSDNCFTVDGTTPIDEVSDLIGIDLPDGDYDTIAGFIISNLERIPGANEHPTINFANASFTVECVEDRRISKIMILVDRNTPAETAENSERS
ncbi:MAG: HlyC/CorC family transporter [Ruminococcaceae bacterium]|nr:HlyC/CorC family transporter [Oscillospiraceae bacterium]